MFYENTSIPELKFALSETEATLHDAQEAVRGLQDELEAYKEENARLIALLKPCAEILDTILAGDVANYGDTRIEEIYQRIEAARKGEEYVEVDNGI
jgi:hypothetical protein